ncbi:MAG: hypothetical protein ACKPJJ_24345, partial [Planctomycetaceae bacterium]
SRVIVFATGDDGPTVGRGGQRPDTAPLDVLHAAVRGQRGDFDVEQFAGRGDYRSHPHKVPCPPQN